MLGYDIQGRVLRNKVHSVHRAAVLASCGVLKDGGRHVESGGLACFSWDDRPLTSLPVNGTCLGLRLRLIGLCWALLCFALEEGWLLWMLWMQDEMSWQKLGETLSTRHGEPEAEAEAGAEAAVADAGPARQGSAIHNILISSLPSMYLVLVGGRSALLRRRETQQRVAGVPAVCSA
jgi:hypothetical protein